MADPPPAPEQRVSLQDLLAGAAVPFLSALCRPGATERDNEDAAGSSSLPIVSTEGVRAVIALAQTGVLGSPSDAAAVLKEIWFSFCPAGSMPCVTIRSTLKELRKAAKEAGVYTGGRKNDLASRLPANVPPAFLKIMNDAMAAEREEQALELIEGFNTEGKIKNYPKLKDDDKDTLFISATEAMDKLFKLPSKLVDKMEHIVKRRHFGHTPSRWFFKKDVAEVALLFHGKTLTEERRAGIMAARDAVANHVRAIEEAKQAEIEAAAAKKRGEEQRLADLNALFEQNGIPACPEDRNHFLARGHALSENHIWPDRRSLSIKEITQERALEAAKEMKWYSEQIPGVSSAANEKYKASDYKDASSYMAGVDDGVAGRGQDALMIVLAKGLGECEEMENRPAELTEAMKRYRQLLELGVRLPERPFSQLADGQYCVSAMYAANKPISILYSGFHMPTYEEAKRAVQEAQFYVKHGGAEYVESRHDLKSSATNAEDTCSGHITAAKAYLEQHGAEAVLVMEPKPPALVLKQAEIAAADAYVAQVGILAAYKAYEETRSVLNINIAAGSSASANVPLALRAQHGRNRILELFNLHVKEENVRATRAIKNALGVLHTTLPVTEHGLGPAIIYAAHYGQDVAPLQCFFDAAKEYDKFWRKYRSVNRRPYCVSRFHCPHSGCMAELYHANDLQYHYRQKHPGVEVPEHHLMASNAFAPAEQVFPALPEAKAFTEYLEQISAAKGGVEDEAAAVKEKWEEWKKKVAEKEAGAGPSGV